MPKASVGEAVGAARLVMVNQKIRQLKMQNVASRLTSRSAVLSFDSSALQPNFNIIFTSRLRYRAFY